MSEDKSLEEASLGIYSEPTLIVDRFSMGLLPPDHPHARSYNLTIEYRGAEKWAVVQSPIGVYTKDKKLAYESAPSSRSDAFLEKARFSLKEATKLATEIAPFIIRNGLTVQGVAELEQRRNEDKETWGQRFRELKDEAKALLDSDQRYRDASIPVYEPEDED